MPSIQKCANCGATLIIEANKDICYCQYCNSPIENNKRAAKINNNPGINPGQTQMNPGPQINPNVNYQKPRNAPPRPRINLLIAIIGLMFYFVPGIIYIVYVTKKQHDWDSKYL